MIKRIRDTINNAVKKYGNKVYDGLGDFLTMDVPAPKRLATAGLLIALTGCASTGSDDYFRNHIKKYGNFSGYGQVEAGASERDRFLSEEARARFTKDNTRFSIAGLHADATYERDGKDDLDAKTNAAEVYAERAFSLGNKNFLLLRGGIAHKDIRYDADDYTLEQKDVTQATAGAAYHNKDKDFGTKVSAEFRGTVDGNYKAGEEKEKDYKENEVAVGIEQRLGSKNWRAVAEHERRLKEFQDIMRSLDTETILGIRYKDKEWTVTLYAEGEKSNNRARDIARTLYVGLELKKKFGDHAELGFDLQAPLTSDSTEDGNGHGYRAVAGFTLKF